MSKEELLAEVSPRLFLKNGILNDEDYDKAKSHISWLFNDQAQKPEVLPVEDMAAEQEKADNVIGIDHDWSDKDPDKEKMVKFFGKDWEEMRPSDKKVAALVRFFEGAAFPSLAPYIEETIKRRHRLANLKADEPKMAA